MANNPAGVNQFGSQQYGDVQRLTQLTREAPMSGAPYSAQDAPRRAKRRAVRKAQIAPATALAPDLAPAPPSLPAAVSPQQAWQQIAQIKGVTPLAKELADRSLKGK